MSERPKMRMGDWINAAFNVLIGLLLGSAIYGLMQLVASGAFLMALILILLGGGIYLFIEFYEKLFDRVFPIGIRPARNPRPQPLLRILSLPLGLMLGVMLALLDIDGTIINTVVGWGRFF